MPPKTARERAEEALAVAERRVKKLGEKVATLTRKRAEAEEELRVAEQRHNYAAKHPDLANNGVIELPEATEDRP